MPSSTSSSKFRFPALVVMAAVFVLVVYVIAIPALYPRGGLGSSAWQYNKDIAQTFIYDSQTPSHVIVGSSLSGRLTLRGKVLNLTFGGGSVYDGLMLIKKSEKYPKVVFIETNMILKDYDGKMVKEVFRPGFYELSKLVPGLRVKYQPASMANIFARDIARLFRGHLRAGNGSLASLLRASYQVIVADAFTDEMPADNKQVIEEVHVDATADTSKAVVQKEDEIIKEKIRVYSQPPNAMMIEETKLRIQMLSEMAFALQKKNVKIVFFEVPMHPKVSDSPRNNFIRESLLKAFPPDVYKWLSMPDPKEFQTTDAFHLNEPSAKKASDYMRAQIIESYP